VELPPAPVLQPLLPPATQTMVAMSTAPGEPGPLPHEMGLEPNTQTPASEGEQTLAPALQTQE
jgi:hypothetical protein